MSPPRSTRLLGSIALGLAAIGVLALWLSEPASASNVAAGLGEDRDLAVPTWLTLLTGGAAVGASALLAALVTDRRFVDAIHEWRRPLAPIDGDRRARAGDRSSRPSRPLPITVGAVLGRGLGLAALAAVLVVGLEGPSMATANLAVVLTFVGVRALLPMIAVLVGDPWPAIDPFRTIARGVAVAFARIRCYFNERKRPTESDASEIGLLEYPPRFASWPAVLGLGALVWLELVLPVTSDPGLLARIVLGYMCCTVAGAVVFSPATWFRRADPLAVLFRLYGAVAPIQRVDGRLRVAVPGTRLRDADVVSDSSEVAFVVLVVWELTFNGFVVTPPGRRAVDALVTAGVPVRPTYLALLIGGFGLALGLYRLAARLSRRTAPTYLTETVIGRRFASSLLAIAAGYHLAHYVAFVVSLAPASLAALSSPLAPPVNPTTLAVPGWMGGLEIAALLAGHVLAIGAAHAIAFDCFPGRLQAIRSQYPFVVVMVCYTAASLWLLTLPSIGPLYVAG